MDDDVALSVAPSDVRGSDFAASVTVKPNVWMTIRPELRQPPQQQVFHTIEAQPNSSNATYWPIVIVFMNVRSPDPPYGSNFTLEVDGLHTIEHRLPDGLKHLANTR